LPTQFFYQKNFAEVRPSRNESLATRSAGIPE